MDTITQYQCHINMPHIHGKDTSIEKKVRSALHRAGFRFRVCDRRYPGSPDLVLPKYNAVIFVNGCFWHRHKGCKYAYTPKSRVEFWEKKFASNVLRDQTVRQELMQKKVKCLIVWECTIKQMMKSDEFETDILSRTKDFLLSDMEYLEL